MSELVHLSFDDDEDMAITSPAHKEIRLDQSGASEKINLKNNLTKITQTGHQNQSDSSREESLFNNSKTVKERFYEFYKQIQHTSAHEYFKDIKRSLLIQIDKISSPFELCQEFEKIYQKSVSNIRMARKAWTEEETQFLVSLITYYTRFKDEDFNSISMNGWKEVSSMFPGKKQDQIKLRWQSFLKVAVYKAPWSTTEDALLIQILKEVGFKRQWKEIANVLNFRSGSDFFRHGKQCRERWINHLDPSINRGAWTTEEDIKLLQSFIELGKKWAEIAKRIGHRTENSVKNRWSTILRRCRNEFGCDGISNGGDGISNESDDTDSDTHGMKKVAQIALQILSCNHNQGQRNNTEETLVIGSDRESSVTQTAEEISIQKLEREHPSTSKETNFQQTASRVEFASLHEELDSAALAKRGDGLSQNISNQNVVNLDSLSPLALHQLSGQVSALMTPQNQAQFQGQSPNFDTFLQNWQNMGISPMGRFLGGLSPMSNFAGLIGSHNSDHHVSNEHQSLLDIKFNASKTSLPSMNSSRTISSITLKNSDASSLILSKTLSAQLGVIYESQREDTHEMPCRSQQQISKTFLNSNTVTLDSSFLEDRLRAAELTAKQKTFEEFSESLIGRHDLQFAVIDISKNKMFYLTQVTADNFRPYVSTMKCDKPLLDNGCKSCSLESSSPKVDNQALANINIDCLNRDLANLAITPKENLYEEKELNPCPSFEFPSLLKEEHSITNPEKELF